MSLFSMHSEGVLTTGSNKHTLSGSLPQSIFELGDYPIGMIDLFTEVEAEVHRNRKIPPNRIWGPRSSTSNLAEEILARQRQKARIWTESLAVFARRRTCSAGEKSISFRICFPRPWLPRSVRSSVLNQNIFARKSEAFCCIPSAKSKCTTGQRTSCKIYLHFLNNQHKSRISTEINRPQTDHWRAARKTSPARAIYQGHPKDQMVATANDERCGVLATKEVIRVTNRFLALRPICDLRIETCGQQIG